MPSAVSCCFSCFGRSEQLNTVLGEPILELGRGVPFVGDEGLAGPIFQESEITLKDVDRDVSFIEFRVRLRERDR